MVAVDWWPWTCGRGGRGRGRGRGPALAPWKLPYFNDPDRQSEGLEVFARIIHALLYDIQRQSYVPAPIDATSLSSAVLCSPEPEARRHPARSPRVLCATPPMPGPSAALRKPAARGAVWLAACRLLLSSAPPPPPAAVYTRAGGWAAVSSCEARSEANTAGNEKTPCRLTKIAPEFGRPQ